jgi:hypothetical protein
MPTTATILYDSSTDPPHQLLRKVHCLETTLPLCVPLLALMLSPFCCFCHHFVSFQ